MTVGAAHSEHNISWKTSNFSTAANDGNDTGRLYQNTNLVIGLIYKVSHTLVHLSSQSKF